MIAYSSSNFTVAWTLFEFIDRSTTSKILSSKNPQVQISEPNASVRVLFSAFSFKYPRTLFFEWKKQRQSLCKWEITWTLFEFIDRSTTPLPPQKCSPFAAHNVLYTYAYIICAYYYTRTYVCNAPRHKSKTRAKFHRKDSCLNIQGIKNKLASTFRIPIKARLNILNTSIFRFWVVDIQKYSEYLDVQILGIQKYFWTHRCSDSES